MSRAISFRLSRRCGAQVLADDRGGAVFGALAWRATLSLDNLRCMAGPRLRGELWWGSLRISVRHCVALAAALSLGACATVTRGANETWTVETSPSGAQVRTSNGFRCEQTPCAFKMPRKSQFTVDITKPGYKPWRGQVTHHVSGPGGVAMAGNVIVGGLIGIGVDANTGAMLDLDSNPLVVRLKPAPLPPIIE